MLMLMSMLMHVFASQLSRLLPCAGRSSSPTTALLPTHISIFGEDARPPPSASARLPSHISEFGGNDDVEDVMGERGGGVGGSAVAGRGRWRCCGLACVHSSAWLWRGENAPHSAHPQPPALGRDLGHCIGALLSFAHHSPCPHPQPLALSPGEAAALSVVRQLEMDGDYVNADPLANTHAPGPSSGHNSPFDLSAATVLGQQLSMAAAAQPMQQQQQQQQQLRTVPKPPSTAQLSTAINLLAAVGVTPTPSPPLPSHPPHAAAADQLGALAFAAGLSAVPPAAFHLHELHATLAAAATAAVADPLLQNQLQPLLAAGQQPYAGVGAGVGALPRFDGRHSPGIPLHPPHHAGGGGGMGAGALPSQPLEVLASAPLQSLLANRSVARFEAATLRTLAKIGEGAFGEVSLVECETYGQVAVKWIKNTDSVKHWTSFFK
jgi:hypothetical protein